MNNDPEYVNMRQQHSHSQLIDRHIHQGGITHYALVTIYRPTQPETPSLVLPLTNGVDYNLTFGQVQ